MTRKVIIEPLAKEDINAARDRYEAARIGMGQEFFDAVIAVIDRLSRTIDGSITLPGEPRVRRILMKRFPYQVVFREKGKLTVHILAVRHTSREPKRYG